jgi:hypothetical protein
MYGIGCGSAPEESIKSDHYWPPDAWLVLAAPHHVQVVLIVKI